MQQPASGPSAAHPFTLASVHTPRQPPRFETCPLASSTTLADFLPGRLQLACGRPADYQALSAYHYRAGPPATWANVVITRYLAENRPPRVVGIAVLSWPTAVSRPRRLVFGLDAHDYAAQLRFANAHLRTISRVIVHPQFRGLGLARAMIRRLIDLCPTRFLEASAAMGALHPMFVRAGMTRFDPPDAPTYFWLDRTPHLPVDPE